MRRDNDVMTLDTALLQRAGALSPRRQGESNDRAKTLARPLARCTLGDRDGPDLHPRGTGLPRADPRLGRARTCRRTSATRCATALRLTRDDLQRWAKILGKQGWLGWGWPKQFGGPGWNAIQKHLFEEECALAGAPRVIPFGPVMVAPVIMAFGTPEQQQRFLPGIASGEVWWSQGYSEPGSGSDLASLKTQGRTPRRQVHRQRPEDLDHARPVRRLDLLPRAHQQRRQAADRHQLPADRHEEPRHHGAADHH